MKKISIATSFFLIFTLSLFADAGGGPCEWTSARPDGHAPIGVMGDHLHKKGEFMLSYRYMRMNMNGNRNGTHNVSRNDVLDDFMVSPTKMPMDMHMAGLMYGLSDCVTMALMVPYVDLSMDHVNRMGAKFTTCSDGVGDVSLTALIKAMSWCRQQIHTHVGLSFPTGCIKEKDDTPAGDNQKLPYPMQIGSGTYDLILGGTYLGQTDCWSWGAQIIGRVRTGKNSEGYRLGNRINGTVWLARMLNDWSSVSVRLDECGWGDIHGRDSDLNPAMVPTADRKLRAGSRLDLLFGVNFSVPCGCLKGFRLAVEGGFPVHQSLDGPQLKTDSVITAGTQYSF